MTAGEFDRQAETVSHLVIDLFEIDAVYRHDSDLVLSLAYRFSPKRSRDALEDRLRTAGYRFKLKEADGSLLLEINPRRRLYIPLTNIVLFIVTVISVYVFPVFVANLETGAIIDGTLKDLANGKGLVFTVAIMSILLIHEMGHYVASRRRHIITSWPYFLPAPNIIGTFGAIIKSKSPFHNRRDLIEVGAAGPIAGWIVAIFWLILGLTQSSWLSIEIFPLKAWGHQLAGESLLMTAATKLIVGPGGPGEVLLLSEAALAGWVGLLVTAINLLPIGQLDGGHILYGMFRERQHIMGKLGILALFILGFFSLLWWVFAAIGLIFRVKHPPTLDDSRPLTPETKAMGIIALVILVTSFTPMPFPNPIW